MARTRRQALRSQSLKIKPKFSTLEFEASCPTHCCSLSLPGNLITQGPRVSRGSLLPHTSPAAHTHTAEHLCLVHPNSSPHPLGQSLCTNKPPCSFPNSPPPHKICLHSAFLQGHKAIHFTFFFFFFPFFNTYTETGTENAVLLKMKKGLLRNSEGRVSS